eukprot:scaffold537_cov180-Ochromonas_danica.AAC.2
MGLLSILKKVKLKERELRIIILGLDNAGKTTVMKRVLGEDHREISPTVGFNIKTLEYNGYLLNLWDVGGQKSIRAYWRNYFEETDGVIWVVDSVDRFRLEECRAQLRDILRQEKLAGSSLLILANKQDLGGALSLEVSHTPPRLGPIDNLCTHTLVVLQTISEYLALDSEDLSGRHYLVLPCSAMTGQGLAEGFDWLVRDISSRIFLLA